ncbi:MAG: winged helix-turn-helix domain-containing protein [Acidobacteria bacterium]|nr:winged helix-turn-helix domain-containing protein [Acidobacteriota bacterium]
MAHVLNGSMSRNCSSFQPSGAMLLLGASKVDTASGEVCRGKVQLRLEPRTLGVLLALAERPGEVVTKQEILERVWPDVSVSEASIWRSISDLRQALDDESKRCPGELQSLIETLPRRGYRLSPGARIRWMSRRWPLGWPNSRSLLDWGLAALLAASLLVLQPTNQPSASSSSPKSAGPGTYPPRPEELVDGAERALALRTSAGIERAIELAQWAIRQDPGLAAAHSALSDAYRRKGEVSADESRWMAAARDSVERAIQLAPHSAGPYASYGSLLASEGRLHLAENALRRALELDPSNTKAANNLGLLLLGRGDLSGAAREFRALTVDHPAGEIFWHNLGYTYLSMDDLGGARLALERAIAANPQYWLSHSLLAQVDLLEGNSSMARRRLEPVLNGGLLVEFGHLVGARIALAEGDLKEAGRLLEPLTGPGRRRSFLAASLLQAEVLRRRGETRQATAAAAEIDTDCRRRLDAGSEDSALRHCLAATAALRGDSASAAAELLKAIEAGYRGTALLISDPVFAAVAKEAVFLRAVERLEASS